MTHDNIILKVTEKQGLTLSLCLCVSVSLCLSVSLSLSLFLSLSLSLSENWQTEIKVNIGGIFRTLERYQTSMIGCFRESS